MPFQLLHPAIFAAGLACVAVPILVHLLTRRRRRTVRWGAMRFLLEAYRKQKRRLQLEQLLLLLMRCTLVALIGLAVAHPFFGNAADPHARARTLLLVIDDSICSAVEDDDGLTALNRAKAQARRLIERLDPARGDSVALLTLARPARSLVLPPSVDLAGVLRALDAITPAASAPDFAGLAGEINSWLAEHDSLEPELIVLSDWLEGSSPIERALKPLSTQVRLKTQSPRPSSVPNIAIAEVQPPRSLLVVSSLGPADLANPVRVRLLRSGPDTTERAISTVSATLLPVSSQAPPIDLGQTSATWEPGQTELAVSIPVRPSSLKDIGSMGLLRVEIDRDALATDNVAAVPIELRQKLRVGIVAPPRFGQNTGISAFEPADWVRLALAPAPEQAEGVDLVSLQPVSLDRPRLAGLDAVIVLRPDLIPDSAWNLLSQRGRDGLIVIVAPPARSELHTWTDPLLQAFELAWSIGREPITFQPERVLAAPPDDRDSILHVLAGELAFLTQSVHVRKALPAQAPTRDLVLTTSTGEPFLLMARPERARGSLALLTAAIDPAWTDLPAKPFMLPLFQELVRQGAARGSRGSTVIAGSTITLDPSIHELQGLAGEPPVRTAQSSPPTLRTAGAWRMLDAEGVSRGLLVSNPDAAASRTGTRDPHQIKQWLAPWAGDDLSIATVDQLDQPDQTRPRGAGFAWMLFLSAFLLALAEMFVARAASHAGLPRSGGDAP